MSVICGISTYHLIDTRSPLLLIGAELSPCMSAWPSLSLTRRSERQMWCERGGEGEYRECGKVLD